MSATLRLCPRCTTSAPCDCNNRRIMLIAASWPSNNEAALTKRNGRGAPGVVRVSGERATTDDMLLASASRLWERIAIGEPAGIVSILASIVEEQAWRKTGRRKGI